METLSNKHCMIINGIIGDIYGAPIEMLPYECVRDRYGMYMTDYIITDKVEDKIYSYTDDTEMTIAVINFLLKSRNNKYEMTKNDMLDCFINIFEPSRGYSLGVYKLFINYISSGFIMTRDSVGNGGLMRTSPLLFVCKDKSDTEIMRLVTLIHYPTHINEVSINVSFIYVKILLKLESMISSANKKDELIKYLCELRIYMNEKLMEKVDVILDGIEKELDEYDVLDELIGLDGVLCYESLSVALWCVLKNINEKDPKRILKKGLFYGGDSDTIGSLIGQMTGLLFGQNAIDEKWMKNIENLEIITNKLNKLNMSR